MTIADLLISLVTLVFAVVFLADYLLVIQALFASGTPETRLRTFFVVDLMLLVGVVVFWKGRQRLKDASASIAQALGNRPGGAAPRPQPNKHNTAELDYKGRMALSGAQMAGRGASRAAGGVRAMGNRIGSGIKGSPGTKTADAGGGTSTAAAPGTTTPTQTSSAQRVRQLVAKNGSTKGSLVRTGAPVAAAAATGGTTAAATALSKPIQRQAVGSIARRAALTARLSPPQSSGGTGQSPTSPAGSGARLPASATPTGSATRRGQETPGSRIRGADLRLVSNQMTLEVKTNRLNAWRTYGASISMSQLDPRDLTGYVTRCVGMQS